MMICPNNAPVRCWDNSCKETIDKCPKWQDCPVGTKQCPDGTCVTSNPNSPKNDCGTQITCSADAPYKCYDNTCKKDPADCASLVTCPGKSPILCWDGKCVSNRADCTPPDKCDNITPVKCPDGTCHTTVEECKPITGCPLGFLQCADGSCRRNLIDCPNTDCPINFPYKCPNGICTTKAMNCDYKNGCTFYAPFKCSEGSCVSDNLECSKKKVNVPDGYQNCPDGSVIPSTIACNLANGCPINSPQLCADRTCIDPTKQACPIPICSPETPYKCLNGLCVQSHSNCPSSIDILTNSGSQCSNSLFPCADGTCAPSPEQCKPLFKCPFGYIRCNDGTCRIDDEFCPIANSCPTGMNYRCPLNGACSKNSDNCINSQGCPNNFPIKCQNNGACVNLIEDCLAYDRNFNNANGCPQSNKFKCSKNGRCVSSDPNLSTTKDICVDQVCPDTFYLCYNNGQCIPEKDKRSKTNGCSKYGNSCPLATPYQCADKTCKKDPLECLNQVSCPIRNPFRCIDGTCNKYPNLFSYGISNQQSSCPVGIQCPESSPYLCSDGSCVEKRDFCPVLAQCPPEKPYRCPDRICRANKSLCNSNNCPPRNPILCRNGNCVEKIFDCADNYCPKEKPIRCSSDECTISRMDCILNKNTTYSNSTLVSPNCVGNDTVCGDGSCRPDISMCPLYEGCTDPSLPYKCIDGTCSRNAEGCYKNMVIYNENATSSNIRVIPYMRCSGDETLCEDGICRKKCPLYNGCPNTKPLMCPDGFCVLEMSECAGIASKCPLDSPFRCIDGTCVRQIYSCPRPKRTHVSTDILIFVYSGVSTYKDIVLDDKNNIIASIDISATAFISNLPNNTNKYETVEVQPSPLVIRSVPSELLQKTITSFNLTRRDDIYKEFPNSDLNNQQILQYEYTVLSPVINISRIYPSSSNYSTPLVLTLAYDFPVYIPDITNLTNSVFNPFNDVCLGVLNLTTNIWNCTKGKTSAVKYVNYEFNSEINSDGIYAVIFKPAPNNNATPTEPNFLALYFFYIMISGGVSAIVLMIGMYVFWRVYRYRDKYKATRKEEKNFEVQMQELQQTGTVHMGQTLGDNMSHIFFTNNPSFKVVKVETKSVREIELENMMEILSKRLRVLENNNENLKNNHQNLSNELSRLMDYHTQ